MKIFLDTANVEEIEEMLIYGFIDGVTTNPALLSKQNLSYKEAITKISNLVENGVVFAEVLADKSDEMVKEAVEIVSWSNNICIKLPMITEGVKALPKLKQLGITVAMTLIYNSSQAIIASSIGADYVAPFVARAYEFGHDGINLIKDISNIYKQHSLSTKILAASIRTSNDAALALMAGADALTLPTSVIKQMISSSDTETTLRTFMQQYSQKNLGWK